MVVLVHQLQSIVVYAFTGHASSLPPYECRHLLGPIRNVVRYGAKEHPRSLAPSDRAGLLLHAHVSLAFGRSTIFIWRQRASPEIEFSEIPKTQISMSHTASYQTTSISSIRGLALYWRPRASPEWLDLQNNYNDSHFQAVMYNSQHSSLDLILQGLYPYRILWSLSRLLG